MVSIIEHPSGGTPGSAGTFSSRLMLCIGVFLIRKLANSLDSHHFQFGRNPNALF